MIRLSKLLWLALPVVLATFLPAYAEEIKSFDADVKLNRDCTLDVTEDIVWDFGDLNKHGIFRKIPVRYTRGNGTFTVGFQMISVTDGGMTDLPYTVANQGDSITTKIGRADTLVTGVKHYRLHYILKRAVNFFENVPEVYWNVTGNESPVPIEHVTARFHAPEGVDMTGVREIAFQGPLGSQTPAVVRRDGNTMVAEAGPLAPQSGLTIAARVPATAVVRPSQTQEFMWWLRDWGAAIFLPLLTFAGMFSVWQTCGRDADKIGPTAVDWNPPKELTPAEVGTLVDERCDMQDVLSTLIDIAAKGYIKIHEVKSEQFLFFSKKDYQFTKLKDADPHLAPHEVKFMEGIFRTRGSMLVNLSDLREKFYTSLPGIKSAIYLRLTDTGYFAQNPDQVRMSYFCMAIFPLLIGFGLAANEHTAGFGYGSIFSALIIACFAPAMPARTLKGCQALRQCLGFKRFVQTAEKERIRVLAQEDPTIFGRLLPYAMVLGAADQWADKFKDLLVQPPDWYVPYDYGPNYIFSPNVFVNDLGSGMNTMQSTFTSMPSSSASSGGSGFSGGFSGGGFGGGGTGSW